MMAATKRNSRNGESNQKEFVLAQKHIPKTEWVAGNTAKEADNTTTQTSRPIKSKEIREKPQQFTPEAASDWNSVVGR